MKELIFSKDKYKMNWLREDCEYAKIKCPVKLEYKVSSERDEDEIKTIITFTNTDNKPLFTSIGDIGIYIPLQDKYESSKVCMTQRCHTHIFCGKNVSYIMALRMGGEAPHLGMVVTKGSIESYSIERDFSKMSNDRGLFILNYMGHDMEINVKIPMVNLFTKNIISGTVKLEKYGVIVLEKA